MSNQEIETKHFTEWIKLKERLHNTESSLNVHEGEIWWCAVGENVGVEINGKNKDFSRPILVLKKLSRYGFMGIPLTSQSHNGSWYVKFVFQNREEYAVLAQAKVVSVRRLYNKIGQLPHSDLELVRNGFRRLFCP